MQGFDFVPNSDQSLTALGFWDSASDGLSETHQVGIWDTVSQTLLAAATIENSDPLDTSLTIAGGQWRYETLASPLSLVNGTTYTLAYQVGPAGLSAADALNINPSTATFSSEVSTGTSGRFLGTTAFEFPSSTFSYSVPSTVSHIRGNANAQFIPSAPVPEPSSLAAIGIAALGAFGFRRLKCRRPNQRVNRSENSHR